MKIRTLTSVASERFAYQRGKELTVGTDIPASRAYELIAGGYATEIPDPAAPPPAPTVVPAPAPTPAPARAPAATAVRPATVTAPVRSSRRGH